MKILLIDNNTVHKNALASSLVGHQVEVQKYQPGIAFNDRDKDLIILSGGGGEGQEIADTHEPDRLWYEDEIEFVKSTQKPLLGICMGFEVICKAYGVPVEEMDKTVQGVIKLEATKAGQKVLKADKLEQLKAHKWHVNLAPQDFDLLVKSKTGAEVIMHKEKPILATQFHPEAPTGTFGLTHFQKILLRRAK